jgi:hypothetical protein
LKSDFHRRINVLRNVLLAAVVTLVVAAPGQAAPGKELRISGPVVRASAQAVSVENAVGDAVLTCAVPARMAEKAAALEVGDRIRMVCVRFRGRRAQLVRIVRLGEQTGKKAEERKSDEKKADEKRGEKQEAAGQVAELGLGVIVVQGEKRLACRVPAEKQAKLEGLKVGDRVKISCLAGQLIGLERASGEKPADKPAGEDVRMYGRITLLSRERVTVQGDAGTLSCLVPAGVAEKLARFAVGDSVKMMCRGSEMTYLEKV